jgi:hypothetical protein
MSEKILDLDDDYSEYENATFYDVSLCFEWLVDDSCITFEMVVDGPIEDSIGLIEGVIEGYGGVAEMSDGTIINLTQYVNAYVVEVEKDKKKGKQIKSKFNIVH